jgi:hypothetical protein
MAHESFHDQLCDLTARLRELEEYLFDEAQVPYMVTVTPDPKYL